MMLLLKKGSNIIQMFGYNYYGLTEDWILSMGEYGVTPFHPISYPLILLLHAKYKLRLQHIVGDEKSSLIIVKSVKECRNRE